MTDTTNERAEIIAALYRWIAQRPGLEYANYNDASGYRSELRGITKDRHHARDLLRYVELQQSITADMLKAAFPRAFSGRLQWQEEMRCEDCDAAFWTDYNRIPGATGKCRCTQAGQAPRRIATGKGRLDYCTGQYWPTEYRRAACAVLASAIWEFWREHCLPEGELMHKSETGETMKRYKGLRAGDYLRRMARNEFGRGIAGRWFN